MIKQAGGTKKNATERKIQKYLLQLQTKIKNVKEYNAEVPFTKEILPEIA